MKIYHYTKGINIESIFNDGVIATERKRGLSHMSKLTDYVWLTESKQYPKTALPLISEIPSSNMLFHIMNTGTRVDLSGIAQHVGGVYRFGFDVQSKRFRKWKFSAERKSIAKNRMWQSMEAMANMVGDNVGDFWISTDDVVLSDFSLESFEHGKWVVLMDGVTDIANYKLDVAKLCARSRLTSNRLGISLDDFRSVA